MRHFCNVGSRKRLNRITSELEFKSLFFVLISFFAIFIMFSQPASAASSPSYKYYSSGTEIGVIGGQFGDKTVVLKQKSTGSYTYTGTTQADIKYGWFNASVNCIAGIQIIVNSKNTAAGDISMPPELNYANKEESIASPESVRIPICTKDDISHLTDFNKKNITISGSFSSTAQKAVDVTVSITMSKNSVQGSYGPEAITINSLTSIADTSTGTSIATINTDAHTISSNDDTTAPIALKAKFDNIQNGFYRVCIINSQLCSANFEKKINTLAEAQINIPADQSDQFVVTTGSTSTCAISGIGWILCPVMNFMGGVVDESYGIVGSLLSVHPINTNTADTGNGTYRAWAAMRTIANIAFVIGFLIIIFSQLTGFGIDNYGIKKLLPRIIIAAILVNLSYFICVIAVDLSNIIGSSLKQFFDSIGANIAVAPRFWGQGLTGWAGLVQGVLAGGGVVAAIGIFGGFSLLLPALIAALLAIVIVFLVLTIRQALIILLIVISPIAFVAFLLPNTEKYFKQWRQLLTTLLLMYPIIAAIFGGSALASKVILSDPNAGFAVQVMGALVAIIPLALTPIVMKSSGSLLGSIGSRIQGLSKKPSAALNKGAANIRDREQARMNNAALNRAPGLFRNTRGTLLRRNARLAAIKQNQERELTRAKTGYIATEIGTNQSFLNKMAAGGGEQAVARARANAVTEQNKAEEEQVANAVILYKAEKGPEAKVKDTASDYSTAARSGDRIKALALQNILRTSGAPGIAELHNSIESLENDGVFTENDTLRRSVKRDILNAGLKGKDAGLNAWSYSSGVDKDIGVETTLKNLGSGKLAQKTFGSLTDVELSGQSTGVIEAAIGKSKDSEGNYKITSQIADSLLINPTTSSNLGRSGTREIFEEFQTKITPPTAPTTTPPPVIPNPTNNTPIPPTTPGPNGPRIP